MNKKRTVVFVIALLVAFGAFYFYNNVLYKEARNVQKESAEFSMTPLRLSNAYTINAANADSMYLNKTIQVYGKVTEVTDSSVVLDKKVFCKMNTQINKNVINKQISIKGRCIGYDDLFEVVKLDQCSNR